MKMEAEEMKAFLEWLQSVPREAHLEVRGWVHRTQPIAGGGPPPVYPSLRAVTRHQRAVQDLLRRMIAGRLFTSPSSVEATALVHELNKQLRRCGPQVPMLWIRARKGPDGRRGAILWSRSWQARSFGTVAVGLAAGVKLFLCRRAKCGKILAELPGRGRPRAFCSRSCCNRFHAARPEVLEAKREYGRSDARREADRFRRSKRKRGR